MRMGSPRGRSVRGGPERSGRGAGGQVQKKRRGQPREAARRADCNAHRLGRWGQPRGDRASEAARRGASGDQRGASRIFGRREPKRRRRALRVAQKTAHRLGRREGRDHGAARSTAHLPRPAPARYIDKYKRRRRRLLQEMAPRRAALRAAHAGQLRLRRAERRYRARARHEPREERRELQTNARRLAVEGRLGVPPKRLTRGPLGQLEHGLHRGGPDEAAALADDGHRQARAAPARVAHAEPVLRRAVVVGAAQFATNRGVPEAELGDALEKRSFIEARAARARARGSSS